MIDSAYLLPGQAEPLRIYSKEKAAEQKYDLIPGFVRAKTVERVKHFPPPKLPKDFKPIKIFPPKPIEEGRALLPVSCLYFIIFAPFRMEKRGIYVTFCVNTIILPNHLAFVVLHLTCLNGQSREHSFV